jgi:hypothetical protein
MPVHDDSPSLAPYREARKGHYVCLCCLSLSARLGPCRRCKVPRLDLEDPSVAARVADMAELRLSRRRGQEEDVLFALSLAVTGALYMLLDGVFRISSWWWRADGRAPLFAATAIALMVLANRALLVEASACRRRSAIAVARRRRRRSRRRAVDPGAGDELGELEELLRWLGARHTVGHD